MVYFRCEIIVERLFGIVYYSRLFVSMIFPGTFASLLVVAKVEVSKVRGNEQRIELRSFLWLWNVRCCGAFRTFLVR